MTWSSPRTSTIGRPATVRALVAGARNFGFVPDVNPTPTEKARALLLEAFRIGVRAPIHAEHTRFLIIDNVSFLHDESPRKTP